MAVRSARGMSQERLGELTQLHSNTISRIENGEVDTKINSLLAIADALQVPLADLMQNIRAQGSSGEPSATRTYYSMLSPEMQGIVKNTTAALVESLLQVSGASTAN